MTSLSRLSFCKTSAQMVDGILKMSMRTERFPSTVKLSLLILWFFLFEEEEGDKRSKIRYYLSYRAYL